MILVFVEHKAGKVKGSSAELLGAAKKTGLPVAAIVLALAVLLMPDIPDAPVARTRYEYVVAAVSPESV